MYLKHFTALIGMLILLLTSLSCPVVAITINTLANYNPAPNGSGIERPILGSDGNFYGVTGGGGAYNKGAIYKMTPAGVVTIMASFNGTNGADPTGMIQATDGNFYGATYAGGSSGNGAVFKMTPAGALSQLAYFTSGSGGYGPNRGLVQAGDGALYGTNSSGGTGNLGTIFKVTLSGTVTTPVTFTNPNGWSANSGLTVGSDGNLYGTTSGSGGPNYGTYFELTTSGVYTTLEVNPLPSYGGEGYMVLGTNGNFYGVSLYGGTSGYGSFFRMTPAGTVTTLFSFNTADGHGVVPFGCLVEGPDGNFYGSTSGNSGSAPATIFKATPDGVVTTLVSGSYMFTGAVGSDGNIYGAGSSTLLKMTPAGVVTTLNTFPTYGANPQGMMAQGNDGNFYGTDLYGSGSVYKMTPAGAMTNLVTFNSSIGFGPRYGLIKGTDGNFYGTTTSSGPTGAGTVFKVTPAGVLTTLASFTSSAGNNVGGTPISNLVLGTDGNFYGMTSIGGANNYGSLFKMTPTGTLSVVAPLTSSYFNTAGSSDFLVQGPDGNFYGTTGYGGTSSSGNFFSVTPSGVLTQLVSFNGTNGITPTSLMVGSDGNFYGTTFAGGAAGSGTVFKITAAGALTTVVSFDGSNNVGIKPNAMVLGTDGNFYGTTLYGGTYNFGTIFKMTPAGVLSSLKSFDTQSATNLYLNSATPASDGSFYITTYQGGNTGAGMAYNVNNATTLNATFNSASDVPTTTTDITFSSVALNFTLNFVPSVPSVLTVINNTGTKPINGTFTNLPNGGTITSSYHGVLYTYTANYSGGDGNDLTLTLVPTAPSFALPNSATFTVGSLGKFTVHATGAPPPTFNATGLPSWATLDSVTGVLSGTPPDTSGAPYSITLTATNGAAPDATQNFTLIVWQAATITNSPPVTGFAGNAYNFTFTATGTPSPTFSVMSGALPANLSLSSAGVISGTPSTPGIYSGTIKAINGVAPMATQAFSITIYPTYTWWATAEGLTGNQTQPSAVISPDGITNLMKYALGLNPFTAYNPSGVGLPATKLDTTGQYLTLTFTGVASDVTYNVEASSDLVNWSIIQSYSGAPPPGTVTVQDTQAVSASSKRFLRLQVSQ